MMRISIFLVGGLATLMALTIPTVYGLWYVFSSVIQKNEFKPKTEYHFVDK